MIAKEYREPAVWGEQNVRHVLSVTDLTADDLARVVADGLAIAAGRWDDARPLRGKVVGLLFSKTSTRTRTSFAVGAMKLGASLMSYGPHDLQTATGETLADTARVLANYPRLRGDRRGPRRAQSVAFRQAFYKMTSAMAILTWCAGVKRPA
jgi:hypothetical protein